jgi:hypothetical protein
LTVYGGTDYTLTSGAISAIYYSSMKAPFGFPLSPTKWTVEITDTSRRNQTNPTAGTWYNLGAITISVPIGCWKISYSVLYGTEYCVNWNRVTLSTANNSESDADFTSAIYLYANSGTNQNMHTTLYKEKFLSIVSKTSYYLNVEADTANASQVICFTGNVSKTTIRAVCTYL